MHIKPYLFFEGRCDEAIAIYTKAVGAKVVMLSRFKDTPASAKEHDAHCEEVPNGEMVMHATVKIGESEVFFSDGRCSGQTTFGGFGLSLTVKDKAEADRVFNALGDGGQIAMPLDETFFSPRFGMLHDRFGVAWMVIVNSA